MHSSEVDEFVEVLRGDLLGVLILHDEVLSRGYDGLGLPKLGVNLLLLTEELVFLDLEGLSFIVELDLCRN